MSTPPFVPVVSSNIDAIAYDPEGYILYVRFKRGSVYMYDAFPPTAYRDLMKAESLGKYFNANIKNEYTCTPCPDAKLPPKGSDKAQIIIVFKEDGYEIVGSTVDADIIVLDLRDKAINTHEMKAVTSVELVRLSLLLQNDFPSEEE